MNREVTIRRGSRQAVASGGAGAYTLRRAGVLLGHVRRERHTVRTTYTGTRIGYDRTHTCWVAEAEGSRRWPCYRTMAEAAGAVLAIKEPR